jgi:peptide/nickel transport system substrate-binding protein
MKKCSVVVLVVAALLGAASAVHAKTFRWASRGDIVTMDPHAQDENLANMVADQIYESLVTRDKEMKIVPSLALSWSNPQPTQWRFKLRPNVKFHDGMSFTADDVVFSIERALAPTSNFKSYLAGVTGAKKVDNLTVDILLSSPSAALIQNLAGVRIMSKSWSEKNKATQPQNFKEKEETFSSRNTNGTGPYMLKLRETDVKTVLVENPNWWGKREGNVTEAVYLPIKADATRVAALLSGEVDFVLDPPPQDIPRLKQNAETKVIEGSEVRTIFLGLDQSRDELVYSNVKGKNPFKDVRVRQAVYTAIDVEAIKSRIMRGLSVPTALMLPPQVDGYAKELDKRPPADREKAKKLLADAGYPNGFEVTLDCPNNRYINDEQICQAVVAMLAQIGMQVKLNAMPRAAWLPKLQKYDTSFYMLGWGVTTFDAHYGLNSLVHTVTPAGDGSFNYGRYSNPKMDDLLDRMRSEMDPAARRKLVADALALNLADVSHVPLHFQVIPWAMRSNVSVIHRPDNYMTLKWVQVK